MRIKLSVRRARNRRRCLATAFAKQLGAPLQLVVVKAADIAGEKVDIHQADVGFFAIDPKRVTLPR